MMEFTVAREIARPPAEVFAAAADFAGAPARITGIRSVEMLTDGPVGVGTRFRETRIMFGREAKETMEVTVFEPGHRYVLEAESHGCRYVSEIKVEPAGAGSRWTMSFRGEPRTLTAKIVGFLMRPLARVMVNACAKDADDLKRSLEQPVRAAGDGARDA